MSRYGRTDHNDRTRELDAQTRRLCIRLEIQDNVPVVAQNADQIDAIDAEHLPTVRTYVDLLPEGLASFPNCCAKGSIIRLWLAGHDLRRLHELLPPTLKALLDPNLPVNHWVPEAHANALFLALRDLFFDNDDDFVADAHRRNRELLSSMLYRALLKLVTPRRIGKLSQRAFAQFHRGISFEIDTARVPWLVHLQFPPHLLPPLIARCVITAAQAALQLNGAKDVRVALVQAGRTRATCHIHIDATDVDEAETT